MLTYVKKELMSSKDKIAQQSRMMELLDRNVAVKIGQEVAKATVHLRSSTFEREALGEEGAPAMHDGVERLRDQKAAKLDLELRLRTKASKTDTAMALR